MDASKSMSMTADRLTLRAAFGAALDEAMRAAGVKAPQVAARLGLSADAVRKWMAGKSEPEPQTVFDVETALGVAPGDLSRHLGYVPVGLDPSVIDAVQADTSVSEEARELIIATYRQARRNERSRHS